ncbi:MAG: glycosyltransferase family 4 protein [Candidatus Rokubacteria bacterium]|nr:glycosyltransferase family 4 protein [Candidatus Rokubacteria bacterium]
MSRTASRPRISILCFDLADNATGRVELLARLLAPRYDVTVVGPRFGPELWAPAQGGPVTYRAVAGARYPALLTRVGTLVRLVDGDLILASKPRPTSYGIGLLARARRRRPLLLDIDDWELGFFYRSGRWGRVGRALNVANPNGLTWTWLTERLVGRADAITVGSRFLEHRFGGVLIPHVRDTDAWDPSRFDRERERARLGVAGDKVVMFLGTPRGHKGVDDLVEAARGLGPGVVLAIVGAAPDGAAARRWSTLPFVRVIGKIPFDDIPRYLVAADVVAAPQRATSDTVGQVPAKVFDAMALARPVVSTSVSMIPEILAGAGVVVPPDDPRALRDAIRGLLDDPARAEALGKRARERCEQHYSFESARRALFPLVDELLAKGGRR